MQRGQKSIKVGALTETYSPILVLGLECHKTKFGNYSIGNRKVLMAFEREDGCIENITFGRKLKRLEE